MEFVKKHLISILALIAILLLLFPVISTSVEMESAFFDNTKSVTKITGFSLLSKSVFTYLLLIGPALLVAMNYVDKLGKHKGTLAIVVPIICVIALIIVTIRAGRGNASGGSEYMSVESKVRPAIGMFLLFIDYIATIIAGAVTYHNFSLDKAGLDKIKDGAGELFSAAHDKVAGAIQSVSSNIGEIRNRETADEDENPSESAPRPVKPAARKSVNLNRTEEILALIEKLANMKDAGILTEEEFSKKKQQLLEEI